MRHFFPRFGQSACCQWLLSLGLVTGMMPLAIAPALGYGNSRPTSAQSVGGAIAPPSLEFQLAQQLNFNVDNIRPSRGRTGGFARGNACFNNPADVVSPVALVPIDRSTNFERVRVETTVDTQPTFYVFVPEMDKLPETGELVIFEQANDNTETIVHEQIVPLPQTARAGFMPVQISDDFTLEAEMTYRWTVEFLCSVEDRASNVFAEGWVERVDPGEGLVAMLAQSDPERHPELYAIAGHWYDTVESLVSLWQEQPNDPTIQADWEGLLSSVNLEDFVDYPLLDPPTLPAQLPASRGAESSLNIGS